MKIGDYVQFILFFFVVSLVVEEIGKIFWVIYSYII